MQTHGVHAHRWLAWKHARIFGSPSSPCAPAERAATINFLTVTAFHSLPSLIALLVAPALPTAHRSPAMPPDRTEAVLAFERATCAAYQRNDAVALDSLVADGYALTDGMGAVTTKTDDINDAKARTVDYSAFRNQNMKVTWFGSTAIVRGQTLVQGTLKNGKHVDVLVQFTDVIVPVKGRLQLVAGHVSRLRPKPGT